MNFNCYISQVLWNSPFVHCDWFSEKDEWPIVEQDKAKWETKLRMPERRRAERSLLRHRGSRR